MTNILLLYSTTDGHTLTISQRLATVIAAHGHTVKLAAIDSAANLDLTLYDKILIGASIRYGHHSQAVVDFVQRHRAALERKPCGFFSVSVVARKPNRNTPETNPYLQKFLRRTAWTPHFLAVFAGRLDYPRYNWLDRTVIRLIMWLTHGPTDPTTTVEFTDWQAVEAFGQRFAIPAAGDFIPPAPTLRTR